MKTIYYYNKCGTSRKAKRFFDEQRMEYEIISILENPPTKEELREMIKKSGLKIDKFFNKSGQVYRELGLKDKIKVLSEDELLDILATNGKIIKRPLITDGENVTLGWKDDIANMWKETIKKG